MTNLTEQLKKGELPEGFYYFKLPNGETDTGTDFKLAKLLMCKDGDKIEVLGRVPSYEEWEKLNWYAGDGVEENQELKMENKQLKSEYEKECHRADELEDSYWKSEKENLQLKELLKECQKSIHWYQEAYGAMDLDTYTLLAKLNEALQ